MPQCSKCGKSPPHPNARFCPYCGVMLDDPEGASSTWTGRVFADRYRVLRALGSGGMGRVYLAEQQMGTVTRQVAIKMLRPDLAADPSTSKRFHQEAETVTRLNHPNTITFFDFGQSADGTLFIVMEFIEGESLAQALKGGALAQERALPILSQIASSLHEAHEKEIIHRDLKPENVILTQPAAQRDFVKVLDFGIAKRTELDRDSLKLTRAGFVLGTPPYMSPEQLAGEPLDRRSDVYSLGIVAYEVLTGRLPFMASTPIEWATQHISAAPAPFDATPAGALVPEAQRRAILRALAKKAEERPRTALAFIEELSAAEVRGLPSADRPLISGALDEPRGAPSEPIPPTAEVGQLPRARLTPGEGRRWLWIALIFCLAMMAAGVGVGAALYYLDLARWPF